MKVLTTRFGELEVAAERIIEFPLGLLGFPEYRRWILLQASPQSVLFWLQSVEAANLAFILTQPQTFFGDYQVRVQAEELKVISLSSAADGEVFVICNRLDGVLTANLQGPLIFNARSRQARQVVLCDRYLTTRHALGLVAEPALAAAGGAAG